MKKALKCTLLFVMTCAMMLGTLAGCGGSGSSNSSGGASSSSSSGSSAPAAVENWNIGTSSSGNYYYAGAAIAEVLNPVFKADGVGINLIAESTNGSLENARRISSGELKLAMSACQTFTDEVRLPLD